MKNIIRKARDYDIRLLVRWYNVPVNWNSPLRFILYFGDGLFWSPLGIGILSFGILSGSTESIRAGSAFLITIIISGVTFIMPKSRVDRKRPYASRRVAGISEGRIICRDSVFGSREDESFPSGHAFWTSAGMFLCSFFFGPVAFVITGPLAFSMIFFRPNLGVHYPSDTFAGFVMGGLTAGAAVIVVILVPGIDLKLIDFFNGPFAFIGWVFLVSILASVFFTWKRHI